MKIAEAENSAKSAIAIVGGIILPTTECRAGWTSPISHHSLTGHAQVFYSIKPRTLSTSSDCILRMWSCGIRGLLVLYNTVGRLIHIYERIFIIQRCERTTGFVKCPMKTEAHGRLLLLRAVFFFCNWKRCYPFDGHLQLPHGLRCYNEWF